VTPPAPRPPHTASPVSPAALAEAIADAAQAAAGEAAAAGHGVRLAVDGPVAADTAALADAVAEVLDRRAVPVARARVADFLRARSLRLEHGGADPEAFFDGWYDLAALRREVLDPLGPGGRQEWLPGLRDPETDRPLRLPRRAAVPGTVAVLDGRFLARWDVADAVDLLVHLDVTEAARVRRLDPGEHARVLPAWERYLQWYDPAAAAAFVVRYDRPAHPALLRSVTAPPSRPRH
jgi:hypothetical protein